MIMRQGYAGVLAVALLGLAACGPVRVPRVASAASATQVIYLRGGCCGVPGRTGVDDVGFITQMVARISTEMRIDPDRIYATGISNGGMLAYRLACDTRIFAAIGPDSATELGHCRSTAAISVIHIHGTADHNIPYAGGGAVELITIKGAGHQWPGSIPPPRLAAQLLHLDQPSTALNATQVIWQFFTAHAR